MEKNVAFVLLKGAWKFSLMLTERMEFCRKGLSHSHGEQIKPCGNCMAKKKQKTKNCTVVVSITTWLTPTLHFHPSTRVNRSGEETMLR